VPTGFGLVQHGVVCTALRQRGQDQGVVAHLFWRAAVS
jgi:hypothetical protein